LGSFQGTPLTLSHSLTPAQSSMALIGFRGGERRSG
jgi:hypothetical protein